MAFDFRRAAEIVRRDDRDSAPFFAGRSAEIESFAEAFWNVATKQKRQAVFRIFQGPPGCGKTSLADHLEKMHDDVLFVSCEPDDLSDSPTLADRIERAAIESGGRGLKAAGTAAEAVSERLGARPLADAALRALSQFSTRKTTIVLHLDEAHGCVDPDDSPGVGRTLRTLHTVGIGVPCVVLLTGLGHTYETVTSIKGLSRLARNAVCEVGELPERDCVRSSKMMLDVLNATEPAHIRNSLAALTAELAHEWPAHLNGAQVALCEELVRVDGVLHDVDAYTVRERSDAMRRDYYEARAFGHPVFKINRTLTLRILAEVNRNPPREVSDLSGLCAEHIDRAGMTSEFRLRRLSSTDLADTMLEKGLLTNVRSVRDRVNVAIPSMADWAEEELSETGGRSPADR